jgi:hypothetical protein
VSKVGISFALWKVKVSGAEIAGSKPAEPALFALMRQVPDVDAVSVAVSEVALLNVQSVAVPLVTV